MCDLSTGVNGVHHTRTLQMIKQPLMSVENECPRMLVENQEIVLSQKQRAEFKNK